MRMRTNALIALGAALLCVACDYPPVAGYVTEPPPPAGADTAAFGAAYGLEISESTAAGVVFLAYDASQFSGTSPATDARSLDERIARIVPTTREGTVQYGSPHYTGRVFVVYGVSAGATEVEVFLDGKSAGRMPVTVLAQE